MSYQDSQIQRNIPWNEAWSDTIVFVRASKTVVGLFFSFEFMAALPSFPNILEMDISDPLVILERTSYAVIGCALALVTSALISTALLFWIAVSRQERASLSSVLRRVNRAIWPLTILGVKGVVFTVVGLIAFIVPGLYFNFKYSLATLCLVLGAELSADSAVINAEHILNKYQFRLLPLAILPALGWLAPWHISAGNTFLARGINAFLDATFTTLSTIYIVLIFARLLQNMASEAQGIHAPAPHTPR